MIDIFVHYFSIVTFVYIFRQMFSKACEYGIGAAVFIAQKSLVQCRVNLNSVAKALDSPVAYTSKVLQILAHEEIISSGINSKGGYYMNTEQLKNIKLKDIVKAIDGDQIYIGCGLGLPACNKEKPCSVHFQFVNLRDQLKDMLETTTIRSLATSASKGVTYLKR